MAGFRPVSGDRAGARAVGILVPPGRRTVVVVRPRALDFDLLVARPDAEGNAGPGFAEAERADAIILAQNLVKVLSAGAAGQVREVPAREGTGSWVQARVGPHVLIACARQPGQAYRPMLWPSQDKTAEAIGQISRALFPETEQELYTNVLNFAAGSQSGRN